MTIRFQCGACAQPIEIDDEWASKTVACPYCRKTVTAPAESTLDDSEPIPMASAASTPAPLSGQHAIPSAVPTSNRVAVVALVLGITTLLILFGRDAILGAHSLQWQEFVETMKPDASLSENMEAQQAFFKRYPNSVMWVGPAMLLWIASIPTWIATLVCGIIGIRRPVRRGMASAALVIAAMVPILFCTGA